MEGRELPARLQAKDMWGHVDTRTRGPGCVPSRRRRHWAGWKHLRVCGAFAPSTSAGLEHSLLKRGSGLGGVKRRGTAGSLVSEPFVCAQGFANQCLQRPWHQRGSQMWPPDNCPSFQPGTRETGRWVRGVAEAAAEGADGTPPADVWLHVTHTGLCCLQSASQCHLCVASGGVL